MNGLRVLGALTGGLVLGIGVSTLLAPNAQEGPAAPFAVDATASGATQAAAQAPSDAAGVTESAPRSAAALPAAPMPAEAHEMGRKLGRAVGHVDVDQGVQVTSDYLVQADRPAEALALTRAMAADPDVAPLLIAEARRLRADAAPALRARGVLIEAGLGVLDARAWAAALRSEPDAQARALMVASPPRGDDPAEEALLTDAIFQTAQGDADAGVRVAAVETLPGLRPEQDRALVQLLNTDPDQAVRLAVASHLRGADPALVPALAAAADQAADALPVRRAVALALIRIEERAPGALASAGVTRDQVGELLASATPDAG